MTFLSLLTSCLPEQAPRVLEDSVDATSSDDSNFVDDTTTEQAPYWLDSGNQVTTLQINYNNLKNHYIFGSSVHSFLQVQENFTSQFCMHATFLTGTNASKPLIAKATPAVTTDYSTGKRTRYFRIQLSATSGNEVCNKDILVDESPLTISNAPANSSVAFNTEDVCANCLGTINTNSIKIYKINSNSYLELVETDEVSYQDLNISIDMNGNTPGSIGTCSDAGCKEEGFDCCIQGQCVNEATVKQAGASADPQGFSVAESEKSTNPNWYLKYPQYYFSCLEDPQNGGGDGEEPTDPVAEEEARRLAMIADYECVEEMKEKSEESPFHSAPYNSSQTYSKCETSTTTDQMYYESVLKRLYGHCGCAEKDDLSLMVKNCPAYTYKLVYTDDSQTEISSVACVTPANHDNDLPFQDLEVMVSSRSAPHRFFSSANQEIDPYSENQSSVTQEGEPFQYLDDSKFFLTIT